MKDNFVSLEDITKFLPDTVIVVDEQIRIVASNDQITPLFGYQPQEVIGEKLSVLLPHRFRQKHDQHFEEYLQKPAVRTMGVGLNLFGLKKDGTEIDIDVALSPVALKDRRLVIATIRDVTEKKELERRLLKKNEQLELINAELEKFGYMIAHDLKSPLINIHALIHLMTRELPKEKSEKLDEYIAAVQNSLELMTNLISGVSAYSKVGTGSQTEESIDLNLVLAEVRKLVRMPKKGKLTVQGQLPHVIGNKTKLVQAFMNLISNAFKYNDKQEPRVHVSCSEEEGRYHIRVSDNGPGVPQGLRRRIFRLFDKGNSQRKDSQGIGLAIVKKIVEERGGTVTVADSPLGGAMFTFTWPVAPSPQQAGTVSAEPAQTVPACPFQAKIML